MRIYFCLLNNLLLYKMFNYLSITLILLFLQTNNCERSVVPYRLQFGPNKFNCHGNLELKSQSACAFTSLGDDVLITPKLGCKVLFVCNESLIDADCCETFKLETNFFPASDGSVHDNQDANGMVKKKSFGDKLVQNYVFVSTSDQSTQKARDYNFIANMKDEIYKLGLREFIITMVGSSLMFMVLICICKVVCVKFALRNNSSKISTGLLNLRKKSQSKDEVELKSIKTDNKPNIKNNESSSLNNIVTESGPHVSLQNTNFWPPPPPPPPQPLYLRSNQSFYPAIDHHSFNEKTETCPKSF